MVVDCYDGYNIQYRLVQSRARGNDVGDADDVESLAVAWHVW